jgi:two-component system invasion response regulator UvrY
MYYYHLNILIADDHPIIRRGIVLFLKKKFPKATLFECETPDEIDETIVRNNISHAILDVTFPEKSTIHMLDDIIKREPSIQILLFTMHPKSIFEHTLKQYPNVAFCEKKEKQIVFEKLLTNFIQNSQDSMQSNVTKQENKLSTPKLSVMEERVLQLILSGIPIKEIAHKLNIKSNTVSTYKRRILDKKDIDNILHVSKIL